MELVRQAPGPLDYVFICCGGGGLLAGMAAYLRYTWPNTRIIGVEPEDAACTQAALRKGRRVTLRKWAYLRTVVRWPKWAKKRFGLSVSVSTR